MTLQTLHTTHVLVTYQLNWLDRDDDASEWVEHRPGTLVADLIPSLALPDGLRLHVSVNGETLDDGGACRLVQPGDCICATVVPLGGGGGGKNPLAAVAMVALMVSAPYLGGVLAGAAQGLFVGAGMNAVTYGAYAASVGSALVLAGGGVLINAALPPVRPDLPSLGTGARNGWEESATYGWGVEDNPTHNGRPVPVLYGRKAGVTPFLAGRYVSTDGDKQYLNLLFIVAEGPLDAITDVKINDNPVTNYEAVQVETRLGTASQTVIPWFNDTINERPVGSKLAADTWTTMQTQGNAVQALGWGLNCPGLWYANDAGGLDDVTVTVELQYRTTPSGAWVPLPDLAITGSKRDAIRRFVRADGLQPAAYEMRSKLKTAPPTGSRYATDVWWEYLHEIVPDDFAYPHTALLAVRALATDQLSGARPRVTLTAERMTVQVPDTTGAIVQRPADNPAWMALDMAVHPRYGAGRPASALLLGEFAEAAAWCVSKDLLGAIYFDGEGMDMATAWDYLGRFGRFRVVQRGTRLGCISDRPADLPDKSYLVASSNTLAGSLGLDYVELKDRADAVRVTYFPPDKGRDTILVMGEHYGRISGRQPVISDETLYPCTDRDRAYRHGVYLMRVNRYITRRASLRLGVEAWGPQLQPGKVLQIANDVAAWGQSSGRVVSATAQGVVLSSPVDLEPGRAYQILVKHSDLVDGDGAEVVETAYINGVTQPVTTDALTLVSPWQHIPAVDCVATVGEVNRTVRWYRIERVTRNTKLERTVEALEYVPEVYADEGVAPSPGAVSTPRPVVGLAAAIVERREDGLSKRVVALTWRGAALGWHIYARRMGDAATAWAYLGNTRDPSYICYGLTMGSYWTLAVSPTTNPSAGQSVDINLTDDFGLGNIVGIDEVVDGVTYPVEEVVDGTLYSIEEVI